MGTIVERNNKVRKIGEMMLPRNNPNLAQIMLGHLRILGRKKAKNKNEIDAIKAHSE